MFYRSFVGVAPEASLYMYKVFGDYADATDTDTLIDAFLMAYNDGVSNGSAYPVSTVALTRCSSRPT